jgi:hypothetical protein
MLPVEEPVRAGHPRAAEGPICIHHGRSGWPHADRYDHHEDVVPQVWIVKVAAAAIGSPE